MVEQYLGGPQVSTESHRDRRALLHAGLFATAITNIWNAMRPSSSRMAAICPAICRPTSRHKVRDLVARAASAMGITNGTVKGDIVVHEGEPYVIELAARLSGGFFCTREIPLNTGVDFIGAAIKIALGEPVTRRRTGAQASARRWCSAMPFPNPARWSRSTARRRRARFPASPKWSSPPSPAMSFRRPATSGPRAAMVLATGASARSGADGGQ